ncbi:MAG TPA: IS630 family transposase [Candidatus Competibacteraceae bacterium]|nr:IS630 family transposase [Candidatus Competibacteraceae bacterium]
MVHKYLVDLTEAEREYLLNLIKKGKPSARKVARAHVLLRAAAGAADDTIAQTLHLGVSTVHRTRQRFVDEGLIPALSERLRQGKPPTLTSKQTAFIVALACSTPPQGYCRWTMQLLADRLIELRQVEAISHDTVRRILKKNHLKPWQRKEWCIPRVSPDYVWHMEDVLELYAEPYDARYPQICFDESPVQLTSEKRRPLPVRPGQPECYDYEYKREGTANLFLFVQPLRGWRHVNVTAQRTTQDFAQQMKLLVDVYFPAAERIRLVVDNLNTHTPAALYQAFAPAEARRLIRKVEFHYTPKHGSWLNMAECEFAVLAAQCLDRRIPDSDTLRREIAAWQTQRNRDQAKIHWQFGTDLARVKLKRLYPSIEQPDTALGQEATTMKTE